MSDHARIAGATMTTRPPVTPSFLQVRYFTLPDHFRQLQGVCACAALEAVIGFSTRPTAFGASHARWPRERRRRAGRRPFVALQKISGHMFTLPPLHTSAEPVWSSIHGGVCDCSRRLSACRSGAELIGSSYSSEVRSGFSCTRRGGRLALQIHLPCALATAVPAAHDRSRVQQVRHRVQTTKPSEPT